MVTLRGKEPIDVDSATGNYIRQEINRHEVCHNNLSSSTIATFPRDQSQESPHQSSNRRRTQSSHSAKADMVTLLIGLVALLPIGSHAAERPDRDRWKSRKLLTKDSSDSSEDSSEVCGGGCLKWYDGCNICDCIKGKLKSCTKKKCDHPHPAYCQSYSDYQIHTQQHSRCDAGCKSWYDGCNKCSCENGETTMCTEKECLEYEKPECLDDDHTLSLKSKKKTKKKAKKKTSTKDSSEDPSQDESIADSSEYPYHQQSKEDSCIYFTIGSGNALTNEPLGNNFTFQGCETTYWFVLLVALVVFDIGFCCICVFMSVCIENRCCSIRRLTSDADSSDDDTDLEASKEKLKHTENRIASLKQDGEMKKEIRVLKKQVKALKAQVQQLGNLKLNKQHQEEDAAMTMSRPTLTRQQSFWTDRNKKTAKGSPCSACLVQGVGYLMALVWLLLLAAQGVVYKSIGDAFKKDNPDSPYSLPFNPFAVVIIPRSVLGAITLLPALYYTRTRFSICAVICMLPISFLVILENVGYMLGSAFTDGTLAYGTYVCILLFFATAVHFYDYGPNVFNAIGLSTALAGVALYTFFTSSMIWSDFWLGMAMTVVSGTSAGVIHVFIGNRIYGQLGAGEYWMMALYSILGAILALITAAISEVYEEPLGDHLGDIFTWGEPIFRGVYSYEFLLAASIVTGEKMCLYFLLAFTDSEFINELAVCGIAFSYVLSIAAGTDTFQAYPFLGVSIACVAGVAMTVHEFMKATSQSSDGYTTSDDPSDDDTDIANELFEKERRHDEKEKRYDKK